MDESLCSSHAPAPFLIKTYEMVDDSMTNPVVSWSESGCSFVVWNPLEFARDLLPKYFKHNNFSSFVRQLNTYGFRKIDPDQWEFANEEFIRGQRHLLKNIHRRKPIHSHAAQNQGCSSVPLTETEKNEFEDEIKRLKQDKSLLQLELQRNQTENQELGSQIQSLCGRLRNVEHRQMQLMAFLAKLMQKPEFASVLIQQSETHNKKRRLLNSNHSEEFNMEDNQIFSFQKENLNAVSAPIFNLELIEKLELSLNFWETFVHGVGEALTEDRYGFGVLSQPSPLIVTEVNASSGYSDMDGQPCSPRSYLSSPHSTDVHSSPELAGYTNHVDSPVVSSIYLNVDIRPKSSGIDVNYKPASAPDVDALEEQNVATATLAASPGANDLFWEQFLTETPGSSSTEEVQSKGRDTDGRMRDSKPADHRNFWWKTNNIDNLAKRMGQLTPAEEHNVGQLF